MDKKLLALLTLFFISFAFFAVITVFNKPITQLTRAKEDANPSPDKSRMIAWPLSVKADGVSEAVISVFVVSESDKPISNKIVSLTNTLGQLRETSSATDSNGKTTFHLTSTTPGIAEVEAIIDSSIRLSKKISIKFE